MILTEEEAKTKWCPQTFDPSGDGHRRLKCVGSACMAWRWVTNGGHYEAVAPNHHGPSFARLIPGTGTLSTTHGYCGKAGKL